MENKVSKKLTVIIIGLIILILIALGFLFVSFKGLNTTKFELSNNQIDANNPNLINKVDDQYFELVGFGRLEINNDNRNLNLINPSNNTVYLSFGVIYDNESLYQTKFIEPGKMEVFDIYSCLNAGEHTITYSINVYDLVDQKPLWTGIKQEQEIIIKK